MIDGRFLALMAVLAAAGAAAGWPLVDRLEGGPEGLAAGLGFSIASFGLGHHWIRRCARRDPRRFVGAVLGVFAARVVALLGFALVLALATEAHLAAALLTVVAAHFALGTAEVVYLQRTDGLE